MPFANIFHRPSLIVSSCGTAQSSISSTWILCKSCWKWRVKLPSIVFFLSPWLAWFRRLHVSQKLLKGYVNIGYYICMYSYYSFLLFNHIQILETGRSQYGYRHYCEKTTFPGGSTKSRWWTDGELIRLPSGWRGLATEASSIDGSGTITHSHNWYQLDQKSPGGNLC